MPRAKFRTRLDSLRQRSREVAQPGAVAADRRVFALQMQLAHAMAIVEEWLALPNVRLLRPAPRHLPLAF